MDFAIFYLIFKKSDGFGVGSDDRRRSAAARPTPKLQQRSERVGARHARGGRPHTVAGGPNTFKHFKFSLFD